MTRPGRFLIAAVAALVITTWAVDRWPVEIVSASPQTPELVGRAPPRNSPEARILARSSSYEIDVSPTSYAGVLSGANGIEPGLVLRAQHEAAVEGTHNLALSGRVYVRATAANGRIAPGDLLTASATAGYAMKATDDAQRTRGAVIGKAMSSLPSGRGFVLLLVQPQ